MAYKEILNNLADRTVEVLRGGAYYFLGSLAMVITNPNYSFKKRQRYELARACRTAGLGDVLRNDIFCEEGERIFNKLIHE